MNITFLSDVHVFSNVVGGVCQGIDCHTCVNLAEKPSFCCARCPFAASQSLLRVVSWRLFLGLSWMPFLAQASRGFTYRCKMGCAILLSVRNTPVIVWSSSAVVVRVQFSR